MQMGRPKEMWFCWIEEDCSRDIVSQGLDRPKDETGKRLSCFSSKRLQELLQKQGTRLGSQALTKDVALNLSLMLSAAAQI